MKNEIAEDKVINAFVKKMNGPSRSDVVFYISVATVFVMVTIVNMALTVCTSKNFWYIFTLIAVFCSFMAIQFVRMSKIQFEVREKIIFDFYKK